MNTTKQRVKYRIHLPPEAIKILRWHMETQLVTTEQKESDLLFPAVTGGFRSPSVLNKPFAEVAGGIGLGKRFTQRALRRTFNDLARAAHIEGVVTKSISGHLTEKMRERYSTVGAVEQRESIAKVIDFAQSKQAKAGGVGGEERPASGEEETKTG
jgi:integrase